MRPIEKLLQQIPEETADKALKGRGFDAVVEGVLELLDLGEFDQATAHILVYLCAAAYVLGQAAMSLKWWEADVVKWE